MQYLILTKNNEPFYTNWYSYENNYSEDIIVIFDIINYMHSFDGETWIDTELDHL